MGKINFSNRAQGTIGALFADAKSPRRNESIAQGTIEYLVVIAVVVVISLVVVALLLGIFESNSDVGTTAQQIQTQTLPVAINDVVFGSGDDANGLIILTNNTGDIIRDVRVLIDGKDHNYFGINVAQGNKVTFKLNSLSIPCPSGQDKVVKNITILYTTKNGLEQKQILENITLQCTQNPTSTTTPVQENQQEETETPEEPEPTDTTPPDVILVAPIDDRIFDSVDGLGDFEFEFTPNDDVNLSDCNLFINGVNIDQLISPTKNATSLFTVNLSEYENGDYSWNVVCTDTSGKTSTNNDFNFSINIPDPLSITLSEVDIVGTDLEASYDISFTTNKNATCELLINSTEYTEAGTIESTANTETTIQTDVTEGTYDLFGDYNYHWNYTISCETETESAQETGTLTTNYRRIYFIRNGLIGYWPLNEDMQDYSVNENHGTCGSNCPNYTEDGGVGGAYIFNGSSNYIGSTNTSSTITGNSQRTITAWVKLETTTNTHSGDIVNTGNGDCPSRMFSLGSLDYKLHFWSGCNDQSSNLSIPTNEWAFVAIVYNGTNIKATVNSSTVTINKNSFSTVSSKLFIGAETTNNGTSFRTYFDGGIDEVAVWNRALSTEEITALYNSGNGLSLVQ